MTKRKEPEAAAEKTKKTTAAKTSQQQAPQEAAQAPEEGKAMVVHAPNGLNLRRGPSTSRSIVRVLANGERVTLIASPCDTETPGWAAVKTAQGRGFVMTEYLRAVPEAGE